MMVVIDYGKVIFDILIIWEGVAFMWKITSGIFIKSSCFETPWVRKNGFYESVCLYVICLSGVSGRNTSR